MANKTKRIDLSENDPRSTFFITQVEYPFFKNHTHKMVKVSYLCHPSYDMNEIFFNFMSSYSQFACFGFPSFDEISIDDVKFILVTVYLTDFDAEQLDKTANIVGKKLMEAVMKFEADHRTVY